MKNKLLLAKKYKLIGIIVLVPFVVLGIFNVYENFQLSFLQLPLTDQYLNSFDFNDKNFTNEVALSGVIVGLLLIAFSREKMEDEFINKIRLESWQWAVLINYILLLFANWLIYGTEFLQVMLYNMLTILIIFIIRFHWSLSRYRKQIAE